MASHDSGEMHRTCDGRNGFVFNFELSQSSIEGKGINGSIGSFDDLSQFLWIKPSRSWYPSHNPVNVSIYQERLERGFPLFVSLAAHEKSNCPSFSKLIESCCEVLHRAQGVCTVEEQPRWAC